MLVVFEGDGNSSPSHELHCPSNPVAFCHFRFDMEEEENVLYLYEIQIAPEYRGRGLGSFLIRMMELISNRTKMSKIMLTMQVRNKRAQAFYERCGFVLDPSSPTGRQAAREGYKIYCKSTVSSSPRESPADCDPQTHRKVKKARK